MNIRTQNHNHVTWIDIESPVYEELLPVLSGFNISDDIVREICNPTMRAKAEFGRESIYLTLHFPSKHTNHYKAVEIDFVIKKDVVITAHYEPVAQLDEFVQKLSTVNISERGIGHTHGGAIFAYFIRDMYKSIESQLDEMGSEIQLIEKEIFHGNERKSIEDISLSRRKIFDFEAAIRFHKEVLESYCATALSMFGREYAPYGEFIMGDYFKIWNTIEHQKNMLLDLKDTNDFLINHKTNELVKSFTVISFIILPLSFLVGFFGMNTSLPKIFSSELGIVYVMCIMIALAALIVVFLKNKKWI